MANPGRELSSIDFGSMIGGPLNAVIEAQSQSALASVDFIKKVGFRSKEGSDPYNPQVGDPIYVTFRYPKEVAPYQPGGGNALKGAVTVEAAGTKYVVGDVLSVGGENGSGATVEITSIENEGKITAAELISGGVGYSSKDKLSVEGGAGSGATLTFAELDNSKGKAAIYQDMNLQVPMLTMLPIPFIRIEETTIEFNAKINAMQYAGSNERLGGAVSGSVSYPPVMPIAKLKVSASYQKTSREGSRVQRSYSLNIKVRAVQDDMPPGLERILGILEDAMTSETDGLPKQRTIAEKAS